MIHEKIGKEAVTGPQRSAEKRARRCRVVAMWLALVALLCLSIPTWAESSWRSEIVDDGVGADVGRSASLVIDSQGNFHIGYYDDTHNALWYTFRANGDKRWFKMAVERSSVAAYLSLAVDAEGRPHLSFVSRKEDGLHYAFWDGKLWHKEIIDPTRADYFNSIQLDSEGHPRISYYQYHDSSGHNVLHLKYAYFDGQQWYIQTVDRRTSTGKHNSIAVDPAGRPHIAYTHVGLGDLLYAYWDGTRWQFSDADSRRTHNHYVGVGNSIALDGSGNPHIAYFDDSDEAVKYTRWDGNQWKTETIDKLAARAELDHVSLKIDSHDRPHIAFYDAGAGVLKYATQTEKGWSIEVADRDGNVGMTPSLYLDDHGEPYIAYYDVSRHALKLAHREPGPAKVSMRAGK